MAARKLELEVVSAVGTAGDQVAGAGVGIPTF